MKKIIRRHGRSIAYLMTTDWLILVGSFVVSLYFRPYDRGMNLVSRYHVASEIVLVFVYALLMIGIFGTLRLYKRRTVLNGTTHLVQIIHAVLITTLGYLLLRAISKNPLFVPSRRVVINWGWMLFCGLAVHRMILYPALMRIAARSKLQRRVVLIGDSDQTIYFAEQLLREQKYAPIKPIGFISEKWEAGKPVISDLPCLGRTSEVPELVEPLHIEGAIITRTDLSLQDLMDLIEGCIRLFGWVDVHTEQSSVWHTNLSSDTYFDIPFVRMREIPSGPLLRLYKELTDKTAALLGILLLSPVLLATALAVKLTSPGPIFYTRERIGKDGKPFPFYKFRSMTVGADQDTSRLEEIRKHIQNAADASHTKVVNTAYITPVGKFIRKWAIDELPQLFNVLKGDMSLIGPRPVPPGEHELTDEWHKRRFAIKPGCTGLWKIYAARTGVSFDETVLYDLYYARNMNPMLDLYVVIMTLWVILTGRADG